MQTIQSLRRYLTLSCVWYCMFLCPLYMHAKLVVYKETLHSLTTIIEHTYYQELLKIEHTIDIDAVYVPYSTLIASRNPLGRGETSMRNGFTICRNMTKVYSGKTVLERAAALKKAGIRCVFTPAVFKKDQAMLAHDYGINVFIIPYIPFVPSVPSPHKDLLYSFVGRNTHRTRAAIFAMSHPADTVIKHVVSSVWPTFSNDAAGQEFYKTTLARSRFSLCPPGLAPGSIRFYESLPAGAIPVIIGDDTLLPDGFDWESCSLRVQEQDIQKIPQILAKISPETESAMRERCLRAYQEFSGSNILKPLLRGLRATLSKRT